jgi:hypothetical protein
LKSFKVKFDATPFNTRPKMPSVYPLCHLLSLKLLLKLKNPNAEYTQHLGAKTEALKMF